MALAWSAFILLFFSASGSKLPAYVLPLFPSLALVLGRYLATAAPNRLAIGVAIVALLGGGILVASFHVADGQRDAWTQALYANAQPWIIASAAVLVASCAAFAALLFLGRRWISLVGLAFASLLMMEFLVYAYEELSPRQSGLEVARVLRPLITPETRLYSVGHYDQSLPFYLGRTMKLVGYVDEFETGQKAEPSCCIARIEDLAPDWLRPGEALAIMQPGSYEKLKALGLPMQVLHEDPRRVLVRKP